MDIDKIKDYGTSLLFFLVASILMYQPEIITRVPAEWQLVALIIFGILSQITADERVKHSVEDTGDYIDELQAKIDDLQARLEEKK